MFRVALKLALAATAVWAIWTFVPVRDRTLADRWTAAGNLSTFLQRVIAEATGARASQLPAPRPQARSQKPGSPRERPVEHHTEADRAEIERILAERLSARP
jgi:hypothetical protein